MAPRGFPTISTLRKGSPSFKCPLRLKTREECEPGTLGVDDDQLSRPSRTIDGGGFACEAQRDSGSACDHLLREGPARGLAVGAEEERLGVLGLELILDQGGPETPGGPHLGDLHVEVHADAPEEGQPAGTRTHAEGKQCSTRFIPV